jgi:hypothetical protein
MLSLLARFRRSALARRPIRARRRPSLRPDVERLELRDQPATWIAPDLIAASDTGLSSIDNVTAATSLRFAGATTSPAGTTITLLVDNAARATYVVPLTGGSIFAMKPTTPLADGTHTLQFLDSHTNQRSASLTIRVDTAAPAPSADFALASGSNSGTTTATSLVFDGTGEPGATATLFFDGAVRTTALVAGNGGYRFVVDPAIAGPHQAYVTLTDLAGNTSPPSAPVDVTVVGPTPTVAGFLVSPNVSPNGDGVQDSASASFALSAPATVTLTLYDAADDPVTVQPLGVLPAGPATAALDLAGLADGDYHVILSAIGVDGTAADPVRGDFTIDTTPPFLLGPTFAAGVDVRFVGSDNITPQSQLAFTGIAEPGATVTLSIDGAAAGSAVAAADASWTIAATLSEGTHQVTARAADLAGNATDGPALPVTIDTTTPVVDAGANQTVNEGTSVQLTANVSDPTIASEGWELVSATNGQAIDPVDGPTLSFVPTTAGVYLFRHSATDAAGNVGSADVTVTAIDVPPTLSVTGAATALANITYGLSLSESDPGNEPLTGWHIVWGDGTTSDLAGIATSASHVYTAIGVFTPHVSASQGSLTTDADGPTITVQPPPPPALAQSLIPALQTPEDTTTVFAVSDVVANIGFVGTAGHHYGLAVDGVDSTHGTWQYSLDDVAWAPLSDTTSAHARLLSEGSFLRFIPAADFDGPSQLNARVWDQADPSPAGTAVDLAAHTATVSATDAAIPLDVTPVNDAPTIALPSTQTTFRSASFDFTTVATKIRVADVDDPTLQVNLDIDAGTLTAPANASVTATGNGTAHVQLTGPTAALNSVLAGLVFAAPAAPTTAHLQVHATDFAASAGPPLSASATLTINVANQAPTIVSVPSYSTNANAGLTVTGLLSAFHDSDGDTLQIRLASAPSVGTLALSANGSFTYTPPTGYVGRVQFSVEAWDGYDLSSPLVIAIDVKSIFGLRR